MIDETTLQNFYEFLLMEARMNEKITGVYSCPFWAPGKNWDLLIQIKILESRGLVKIIDPSSIIPGKSGFIFIVPLSPAEIVSRRFDKSE